MVFEPPRLVQGCSATALGAAAIAIAAAPATKATVMVLIPVLPCHKEHNNRVM